MMRIAAILWVLAACAWCRLRPRRRTMSCAMSASVPTRPICGKGPAYAHKVLWVYRHRGYPFAVIAEFDVWRRVQAADGTVGWMSASMLTRPAHRAGDRQGPGRSIIAEARWRQGGGAGRSRRHRRLEACTRGACHIHGEDIDGWIPKPASGALARTRSSISSARVLWPVRDAVASQACSDQDRRTELGPISAGSGACR